jgi:hypothetical protein
LHDYLIELEHEWGGLFARGFVTTGTFEDAALYYLSDLRVLPRSGTRLRVVEDSGCLGYRDYIVYGCEAVDVYDYYK